jgi:uncharacterized protein (TIGR02453 family)
MRPVLPLAALVVALWPAPGAAGAAPPAADGPGALSRFDPAHGHDARHDRDRGQRDPQPADDRAGGNAIARAGPAFRGFPAEAVEFLRELEANNDRDWFKANRARYDAHLVAPARALGEDLADLGRPRLFRPWNDTRFHPRPPIKEHIGLAVGYEGAGGFYVELSLDGLLVAAGLYQPASDQLDRIRRAIDDGRTAAPLTRAIGRAREAGLSLTEPALVRVPRGYAADHPRLDLLRRKSLTVTRRHALGPWLHRPQAGRTIREELESAVPLVRWLGEHVGPSQTGHRRSG